jgi:hypothetical protein
VLHLLVAIVYELPRRRMHRPRVGDDETSKNPLVGVARRSGAKPSSDGRNNERRSRLLLMKTPSMSDPSLSCQRNAGQRRSIDVKSSPAIRTDSPVRLSRSQETCGQKAVPAPTQRALSKKDNMSRAKECDVIEYLAELNTAVACDQVHKMNLAPAPDEMRVASGEPKAP